MRILNGQRNPGGTSPPPNDGVSSSGGNSSNETYANDNWDSSSTVTFSKLQISSIAASPHVRPGVIEPSSDATLQDDDNETLVDPFCVEENPQTITFEDVTSAAFKIKSGINRTPCEKSRLSEAVGMDLYLKKDFLQFTGSFKERGARYTLVMLSEEQKRAGVISASLGNHALALCYQGARLGIPVTVVMPVCAPIIKIAGCRRHGGTVIVRGEDMTESKQIAMRLATKNGLLYVNGYDHPHIMAGQGTLGLEIVEQVTDVDVVVVPVGGGGLIAGIALAVKTLFPRIVVIGVESEKCASFTAARKSGRPSYIPITPTLADGLAVPLVGYNAFATADPRVDRMVVVGEEWISIAILKLVECEKCIVEGGGATGLAAILAGQLDDLKGKRVVVVLSGGNIDTTTLGRCLERGLAFEGRLVKFRVVLSDCPGGIAELCRMVADIGVSIKDIAHERACPTADIFSVEVRVTCETRDSEHAEQLRILLRDNYKTMSFGTRDF